MELAPQGQQTLETGTVVAAALQWKNFCLHDSYVLGVMRMYQKLRSVNIRSQQKLNAHLHIVLCSLYHSAYCFASFGGLWPSCFSGAHSRVAMDPAVVLQHSMFS